MGYCPPSYYPDPYKYNSYSTVSDTIAAINLIHQKCFDDKKKTTVTSKNLEWAKKYLKERNNDR